jgi:hypothetical protein
VSKLSGHLHACTQCQAAQEIPFAEPKDAMSRFGLVPLQAATNVFSSKANDPMWKVVRKGTAPAFQANNMR